ncbi:hypothetical protein D1872_285780 [compost metagenome]
MEKIELMRRHAVVIRTVQRQGHRNGGSHLHQLSDRPVLPGRKSMESVDPDLGSAQVGRILRPLGQLDDMVFPVDI